MKISKPNIGLLIEQKMNELNISKSEMARRAGIANQNVNRILSRTSIDTDRLIAISEALDFNFFDYYATPRSESSVQTTGAFSPASMHGDVSVTAPTTASASDTAVLEERIKSFEERIKSFEERIKSLEALISEKERLIQVLLAARKRS